MLVWRYGNFGNPSWSSVGDLKTEAIPTEAGHYLITGSKMWITGAAQDFTENIVHLVLARIAGAPAGTRGISLFIVPKYRLSESGQPDVWSDVNVVGLNHKMGPSSPTARFGSVRIIFVLMDHAVRSDFDNVFR